MTRLGTWFDGSLGKRPPGPLQTLIVFGSIMTVFQMCWCAWVWP